MIVKSDGSDGSDEAQREKTEVQATPRAQQKSSRFEHPIGLGWPGPRCFRMVLNGEIESAEMGHDPKTGSS